MFLKPHGKIDLNHRAHFLRGTPPMSVVIVAAQDGRYSILSPDLKRCGTRCNLENTVEPTCRNQGQTVEPITVDL